MKFKFVLPVILCGFFSLAQVSYEPGYIIEINNTKKEVFIKNIDWSNNPKDFQYKLSLDAKEIYTGDLKTIKEFGIGSSAKYLNTTVNIDQSSANTNIMSNVKDPEFESRRVFLKQLVEGDANLYSYQDNNFSRFFYNKKGYDIIPLVYKKYKISNAEVAENTAFKKELFDNLKCADVKVQDSRSLKYDESSLSSFITKYNICKSNSSVTYKSEASKGSFHFAVKAGYFNSSLDIKKDEGDLRTDVQSTNVGSDSGFRIAAEAEYVLPFNRNKWAIFVEPGFQSYSGFSTIVVDNIVTSFEQTVEVDYSYVDVPFGLRHYMFINDKNKLFLQVGFSFVFDLSDTIDYSESEDLLVNSSANAVLGFGYVFNNKFLIEGRLNTARNVTRDYAFINSDFTSFGVLVGYRFL